MKFELYTRKDCKFCDAAKVVLGWEKLEYTEIVIEKDITREEVKEKFPGADLLPIVVCEGAYVGGYNDLLDYIDSRKKNANN